MANGKVLKMTDKAPAILVAGSGSGCGKTTVTLGIMAALQARGLKVQPFKTGPDFIDPTLHRLVTGRTSYNLDMRMCGQNYVRSLFGHKCSVNAPDICVVEGVMGMFDGGTGSAAALSSALEIPLILVVDVTSAAESVAAVVHGFETLREDVSVAGVILNKVASPVHARLAGDAVKKYCRAPVVGMIPRDAQVSIPSRHLGLYMGGENPIGPGEIKALAAMLEGHADIDFLIGIARSRCGRSRRKPPSGHPFAKILAASRERGRADTSPLLAVARDSAFCFYYEDNLEMLEAAGVRLVEFSPLYHHDLPSGVCGLYLGGGYPELHASGLSGNLSMLKAVKQAASSGMPVFAECGGFMYLTSAITDTEGKRWEMAGIYPFETVMKPRLSRLGYREAVIARSCILGGRGQRLFGHEFHYSDIAPHEGEKPVETVLELGDGRAEGYGVENVLAGYVHFHWGRTPWAVLSFRDACIRYFEAES